MKARSSIRRSIRRIALIAATVTIGACDAVNEAGDAIDDIGNDADVFYYVSLGTSLARGVQSNATGVPAPTDNGYADQLLDSMKPAFDAGGTQPRDLRLVKLGCPGETLNDMVNGGSCLYVAGSQLDAAVDFLTNNSGKIHVVTIDIGANDFRDANCIDTTVDIGCANAVSDQIAFDLAPVLTTLRDAAGPNTTIVGMNYYNPFLASWLEDAAGQTLAVESALAVSLLTDALDMTYEAAGMAVADVALAFESDNFGTLVPTSLPPPNDILPVNVANICDLTYMCDPDPVGPDIHANTAGYARIAEAFGAVLP